MDSASLKLEGSVKRVESVCEVMRLAWAFDQENPLNIASSSE